MRFPLLLAGAILLCFMPLAHADELPTHDLTGSHDSPIVSRFAGSIISGFQSTNYDMLTLPLGKTVNSKISDTATAKGRITRIAYLVPQGKTALEVFDNFQAALTASGFRTLYSCGGSDVASNCGDTGFDMASAIAGQVLQSLGGDIETQSATEDALEHARGTTYVSTSRLARASGTVDVVLLVGSHSTASTGVLLQICESKPMPTGQVTVNAKAMSQGLAQNGHIALYGIHFTSDSATLSTESDGTLAQMTSLLKSQPTLKVYIVGHTDDSGALAHNLVLSQQRAEAVLKALVAQGISANRMAAKGLASYAPVASNHTDAGKAQNRRVELVEQ